MENFYEKNEILTPIKNYNAPNLPTLETVRKNPELLKKLPRRWQKKAAIVACLSVAGVTALTGCTSPDEKIHDGGSATIPDYVEYPTEQLPEFSFGDVLHFVPYSMEQGFPFDKVPEVELPERNDIASEAYAAIRAQLKTAQLDVKTHHGGESGEPFYVVYFTEQEAFGFIRAKLEAEGLNLSENTPDYSVTHWGQKFTIDLFDSEKNVGVSQISRANDWMENVFAGDVAREFAVQHENITVGAFNNPAEEIADGWRIREEHGLNRWDDNEAYEALKERLISERTPEARATLIENLDTQAQAFIDRLKTEGILPS